MHLEEAEQVSIYEDDFYIGTPVFTKNFFGNGTAYYVGTRSNPAFYATFLKNIFTEAGVHPIMETPEGVEAAVRENEKGSVLFLLNHRSDSTEVVINKNYKNLLTGKNYKKGSCIKIEQKDVLILIEEM
jgi:beta-galactosidase